MVASISNNQSSVSNWADSIFSKLDTKNQGYIEKADLQSALGAAGDGSDQSVDIDSAFGALDGDDDGKVTKSELTEAMTKLSDQLNAQFDASRVSGGMQPPSGPPPEGEGEEGGMAATGAMGATSAAMSGAPRGAGGPPPGGGAQGAGSAGETEETNSTSSTYVAAADTDGDGTVSEEEQAAYDKKVASGETSTGSDGASARTAKADGPPQRDPIRELAHAMNLLKAYADSGTSAATTGSTASSSVSVEA